MCGCARPGSTGKPFPASSWAGTGIWPIRLSTSGWVATVACIPYGDALLVQAVPAERLVPVRDPQPRPPAADQQPT